MTKAFAYLRVSGKGQIEGDGFFKRQEAAIRTYALAHDVKIVKVFKEEGISGTTELENRPALMELLEALAANGTNLVLIEKLDRLARDLMVQETIIGDLRKRSYELISVTEPDLLQHDPTRVLMRQIFRAIAQYEKAMIVAKLRGARERVKAKAGRCEGRKPYGTFQGESETIARIMGLRTSGLPYESIAANLNREGVKPRYEGQWQARVINRIVARAAA